MGRWLRNDDEFVEGVRNWQRWRRPVGFTLSLLGAALLVAALYFGYEMQARSRAVFAGLSGSRSPSTQQWEQATKAATFNMGMGLGFVLAGALSGSIPMLINGLHMVFFKTRKDRLLLALWDAGRASRSGTEGSRAPGT